MRTEPINQHAISRHWRSPGPATTTARLAPLDQPALQLHLKEPVRAPVERDFLGTVTGQGRHSIGNGRRRLTVHVGVNQG
jgi:hypothetical protein